MDSVTQMVLGSAVGVAVMGRSQPLWKSALMGAVVGTLPDLDAFIDYGDGISNMVRHRGETHSLFYQTLAAPLIALVVAAAGRSMDHYLRWWLMVWLVLITHAGLDAMTIYGTQLLLPRAATPYGLGSIFIIDPLYTLPMLLGLLLVLWPGGRHRLHWNIVGLVLSSAYLGWTAYAQHQVTDKVAHSAAAANLTRDRILVIPTPFNSVLWRVVLLHPDRYEEGFYSLLDPFVAPERDITFTPIARDTRLDALTATLASANKLRQFTYGFYSVDAVENSVRITDLRMGQHPYYSFSFEVAQRENDQLKAVRSRNVSARDNLPLQTYFRWLFDRARGRTLEPPTL